MRKGFAVGEEEDGFLLSFPQHIQISAELSY